MSTGPTRNAWLDTVGKDRPPSASPKAGIFVYLYICVYIYIYIHVQWARFTFKCSKEVQTWTLNSISRSKHQKKAEAIGATAALRLRRPRLAEAPSQIAMSSGALLVCSFWCHCSMNLHSMPAVELALIKKGWWQSFQKVWRSMISE